MARSRRRRRREGRAAERLGVAGLPVVVGVYRSDIFHIAKGLDMGLERPRPGRDSLWDWVVRDLPHSLSAFRMPEERHVQQIAEAGIRWVVVTFSAGWGKVAELREQERLQRLIARYHDAGLRVLAYLSMTNLFTRRFFADLPGSDQWVQRDPAGHPIPYQGWRADEVTRYLACVNHPDYRAHQFELVRRAMRFGADGLLVDNAFSACCCDFCKAAFRDFSRERTGTPRLLPAEDLAEADWSRPVIQLAAEFYGASIEKFFAEMKTVARRLNADAVCTMNVHPPRWRIRPTYNFPDLVRRVDLVLSEDGALPASRSFKEVFETGYVRELSKSDLGRDNIDHYRYLRAVAKGRPFIFDAHHADVVLPNHLRLALAEAWSCGGALGYAVPPGYLPDREAILAASREYLDFLNDHADLYEQAELICQVAIVVSHRSMMWSLARDDRGHPNEPIGTDTHLWGFSQALIYNNVPFDYLLEEDLSAKALSAYRVVVLPNAVCLSDKALAALEAFVREGGNLVVTGETALYDENLQRRREYGLAHLTGVRARRWPGVGRVVRRILGKARLAQLMAPIPRDYLLSSDPRLGRELAALIRWCAHGRTLIRVRDLPGVLVFANRVKARPAAKTGGSVADRVVCHFLNYARYPERDEPIERAPVEVSLDASIASPAAAEVFSPDGRRPRLTVQTADDRTVLTLSRLWIYSVVVLDAAE